MSEGPSSHRSAKSLGLSSTSLAERSRARSLVQCSAAQRRPNTVLRRVASMR